MNIIGSGFIPLRRALRPHILSLRIHFALRSPESRERNMNPSKIEKPHAVRRAYGSETARRWRVSGAYIVSSLFARRADRRQPVRSLTRQGSGGLGVSGRLRMARKLAPKSPR